MMSWGYPYDVTGGIPSLKIICFGIDTNTCLFIYFAAILKLFFPFLIHASIFLLVGQLNFNLFKTIIVILNYNILLSPKILQYFFQC